MQRVHDTQADHQTVSEQGCILSAMCPYEGIWSTLCDEDTSSWWQHGLSIVIGKRNSCSIFTGAEGCIVALTSERAKPIGKSDDLP